MNYHYFKMIRSSRLFFFGRKNYNVLQLTQRAALLPKQVYMEFSVIVNREEVSDEEKLKVSDSKSHNPGEYLKNAPIKIEGSEMAYSVLKVMLRNGETNILNQNGFFRDFIQKMVLNKTSDIIKVNIKEDEIMKWLRFSRLKKKVLVQINAAPKRFSVFLRRNIIPVKYSAHKAAQQYALTISSPSATGCLKIQRRPNLCVENFKRMLRLGLLASYSKVWKRFLYDFAGCIVIFSWSTHSHYWSDCCKSLLKTLALTGNRAMPAIRPLCDVLLYRNHSYTEKECSELLFSLAKLSYKNEPLIKLLAERLKRQGSFESPKFVSSLIHSLSILKYRDCELLDKMLSSYFIDPSDIDNAVDVLVSLAHLNYRPHTVDNIIKFLSDFEDTDYQQTRTYINFIWACVLLNKHASIPEKFFRNVLSRNLLDKLGFERQDINVGVHLKMLNIFAAAAEIPCLKEFFQTKSPYQNYVSLQIPIRKNLFLESVKDTLGYIFSKNVDVEAFVDTKAGFFLDFQCTLDSKSSPLLVKTKKSIKFGIVLLNYHDICSDGTLTGLSAFKLNILSSQGYKVMTISYLDYPINAKLSEKIVYLRNAINNCINDSSNSDAEEKNTDQKL